MKFLMLAMMFIFSASAFAGLEPVNVDYCTCGGREVSEIDFDYQTRELTCQPVARVRRQYEAFKNECIGYGDSHFSGKNITLEITCYTSEEKCRHFWKNEGPRPVIYSKQYSTEL